MKIFQKKKYTILSNIAKYSFVLIFGFMLMYPVLFVNAACGGAGQPPCDNVPDSGSGISLNTGIVNPLNSEIDTIPKFIEAIIEIVLVIGVPIVVLAIIYVGFLFVKAQGKPEEITKAKKALLYTLIGAALLLGAFVIANAIGKTVDEIKSTT